MQKTVTKIEPTIQRLTFAPLNSLVRRKVAGYARVSTDSDEQENSYAAQVDYFTEFIRAREDWEYVKIYTDEGITGVNTKRREGFNQMIADALAGKIEILSCKLIQCFADHSRETPRNQALWKTA